MERCGAKYSAVVRNRLLKILLVAHGFELQAPTVHPRCSV